MLHRPTALLVAAGAGAGDGLVRRYERKAGPLQLSTWYEAGLAVSGLAGGMSSGLPADFYEPLALVGVFALASKAVGQLRPGTGVGAPDLYPWGDTGLTTGLGGPGPPVLVPRSTAYSPTRFVPGRFNPSGPTPQAQLGPAPLRREAVGII